MTNPHTLLAVVGAISLFVLAAIGILRGLSILANRNRAQRMAERLGRWGEQPAEPETAASDRLAPSWPSFRTAAAILIVWWLAMLAFCAVGGAL